MPQVLTSARALIDKVALDTTTDLPVMSSAELCALGALTHPMLDAPALAWWNSQKDQGKLTQMALDSLARRQLRDPGTDRVSPPLSLILAGWARPSFIFLTRERPGSQPRAERMYGIADDSGTHAVLVERVEANPGGWNGLAHHFRLAKIEPEAVALTAWIAGRKGRTLDLYLPGLVGLIHGDRLVVTPVRHHRVDLARQSHGTSVLRYERKNLTRLIAGLMTGIPIPN